MAVISLSPANLALAGIIVFLLGLTSLYQQLDFSNRLYLAAIRCTVQLLVMGGVLQLLFNTGSFWAVALLATIMLLTAGQAASSTQAKAGGLIFLV